MATKSVREHVSKAIASRRFVLGWSQAELGAKVGVSRQAVDQWERGQTMPTYETLEALSQAFDCLPSELLP